MENIIIVTCIVLISVTLGYAIRVFEELKEIAKKL